MMIEPAPTPEEAAAIVMVLSRLRAESVPQTEPSTRWRMAARDYAVAWDEAR